MPDSADLTDRELENLYEELDREIAERGVPSDEELRAEIEKLNQEDRAADP